MKYCIDCRWLNDEVFCSSPNVARIIETENPVTGVSTIMVREYCSEARDDELKCGKFAVHFEEKPSLWHLIKRFFGGGK